MINFSGIRVYPYGLAVAGAALICLLFSRRLIRQRRLKDETLTVFAAWCIPLSLLFSRLLYCLICMDGFARSGIAYFFHFTSGGYTLWGAMLGGGLAVCIASVRTGQSCGGIADAFAAPAMLMVALCRLAEGLVGQGYGWYVEDWFDPMSGMSLLHPEDYDFFLRFPFAIQDMYEEWCWAVFVIEALLALCICILLLRSKGKREGILALNALLMLASAQILCESLRQDAVLRFGFVRVNQIIGALIVVFILAYGCVRLPDRRPAPLLFAGCGTILCIALIVAMEFALEKKIVLLEQMPMDVCYLITAVSCLGLVKSVQSVLNVNQNSGV